jgi:hypothetical protein
MKLRSDLTWKHKLQFSLESYVTSKTQQIKIYTIIFRVVSHRCETLSLTLKEEHRKRAFENKVLEGIFALRRRK